MKLVSQLDPAGYLVGPSYADPSPLEPGVFLLPAGCVDAAPIDVPAGKRARYNGTALVLEDIPVPPVQPVTLDDAKGSQIGLLYAAYQAAIAQNITLTTAGGVTKAFQADRAAIDNLQAMLAAFPTTVPSGFYWVASDNTRVPFTLSDMKALASAMGNQGWSAFQRLQDRKVSVLAATTVAQVQAVVW